MRLGGCRRQHPRHLLARSISVRVPQLAALEARACDISYGGIGIEMPEGVVPGDRLLFRMEGWGGVQTVVTEACHVTPTRGDDRVRVGLKWVDLNVEQRAMVFRFVAWHARATDTAVAA